MKITVQPLSSSAIESVLFDTFAESAEVTFVKGGKYTYALQFGKDYHTVNEIANDLSLAESAGAKFNQFVRDGIFVQV